MIFLSGEFFVSVTQQKMAVEQITRCRIRPDKILLTRFIGIDGKKGKEQKESEQR